MKRLFSFTKLYLLAVGSCLYLVTVGVWRRPHREILHEIVFRLGLRARPPCEPDGPVLLIPEVCAGRLLDKAPSIHLLEPDCMEGNVSGYELAIICSLVAMTHPSKCFEFGTFDGRTALNIAANAPEQTVVYTLDLPSRDSASTQFKLAPGEIRYVDKASSGSRFSGSAYAERIVQLYGDSAAFNYAPYEGQMDFIFVDGSHAYEYVHNDTRMALKLSNPKGCTIVWHDYGSKWWKGLSQALNELYQEQPVFKGMEHVKNTTLVVCRIPPPVVGNLV